MILDVVFFSHPSSIYSITYLINSITSVHASFQEHVITGWWLSGACSFTNSQRKSCVETVAGLRQFPLQVLWEKLVWRLELVWGMCLCKSFKKSSDLEAELVWIIFIHKSFKKGSVGNWSWVEAFSFTNPLEEAQLPLLWGFQRHLLVDSLINQLIWFEYLIDWLIN